jgi:isochorismate synthase
MPAADWKAVVHSLTREMRRGHLEKLVLARECRVRTPSPRLLISASPRPRVPPSPAPPVSRSPSFDVPLALKRLRADYPSCFVFAVARGDHCFLGATPERLVRLRDGIVSTMCLAGSSARGATEEEDRRLGDALLASQKERAEHAVVVRALSEALADLCDEVAPISTPVLLKVRNIQHLLTTVVGRVADGRTILDLVERLHPTPAVGGYPRETALRLIRERERLDRGWYAGPIGWLDARGEGEFAVAIRSALLRGPEASLFAGCGIVADSNPDCEYEESCLKLRPMLSALTGAAS